MNTLIACVGLVCTVSGAPRTGTPEDAANVLRNIRSISNRTNVYVPSADEGPRVIVITREAPAPEKPFDFRPLGVHTIHGITFRLPRERGRDRRQ